MWRLEPPTVVLCNFLSTHPNRPIMLSARTVSPQKLARENMGRVIYKPRSLSSIPGIFLTFLFLKLSIITIILQLRALALTTPEFLKHRCYFFFSDLILPERPHYSVSGPRNTALSHLLILCFSL